MSISILILRFLRLSLRMIHWLFWPPGFKGLNYLILVLCCKRLYSLTLDEEAETHRFQSYNRISFPSLLSATQTTPTRWAKCAFSIFECVEVRDQLCEHEFIPREKFDPHNRRQWLAVFYNLEPALKIQQREEFRNSELRNMRKLWTNIAQRIFFIDSQQGVLREPITCLEFIII